MPIKLTSKEIEAYHRDGYVVVDNLVTKSELEGLRTRLHEISHSSNSRRREGLNIQIEPRIQRGELTVVHPGDGIRKMDGLVENDDLFQSLALNENIISVLEQLLMTTDMKMFRNSLLMKPLVVGSQKGVHQDSPYWPIQPMSLCSCWFPLDDATIENGCMAVIPGGHKNGPSPHVSVADDYVMDESYYDSADIITLPMSAGSGLFFHSLLPHSTGPNLSNDWRRAIALSYMSSKSIYTGERDGGPVYFPIQGTTFEGCVR